MIAASVMMVEIVEKEFCKTAASMVRAVDDGNQMNNWKDQNSRRPARPRKRAQPVVKQYFIAEMKSAAHLVERISRSMHQPKDASNHPTKRVMQVSATPARKVISSVP
jgi:hypothetical protein